MLHLYALTEHPAQLVDVAGIDGSKLHVAAVSPALDAVISDIALAEGQASEAAILAHAAVVEALTVANEALLPARFSRGYPSEDALVEAIAGREPRVTQALERVRGCVEIGLRVYDEAQPADGRTEASGSAYMRSRLEEVRGAERTAAELHDALAVSARESTSRVLATPQLLLSAAYLLPRGAVEPFQRAVETVERDRPGLTFVCTGPWPPYSFAMIDTEQA
jgi:hypothetical protein